MTQRLRVLTSRDVSGLLRVSDCIVAVEEAFRQHGDGTAAPPGVLSMHMPGGGFHIKAGSLRLRQSYFCAKVNGNFPGNAERFGLPTIQGVIVLCDAEKGTPLAVMDSGDITGKRTAAATAVAAKRLARENSQVATICGCGVQGSLQLQALHAVRALQQALVFDVSEERAREFASTLGGMLGIPVTAVKDLRDACRRSDICVTCTPSRKALLGPQDVKPGTFIAAVGADHPEKQELEPGLMAKSRVVVDVLAQAAIMGELHHALDAAAVRAEDATELGEIVAGKKPGRVRDDEIIVFDSTGMALQDVAAAALVYETAVSRQVGAVMDFAA